MRGFNGSLAELVRRLQESFFALPKTLINAVAGRRRVYFSTQIDDMLLGTNVYRPINASYRAVPADMDAHITWQQNLQSRMPAGSKYFMEMGHNGNGPLAASIGKGAACTPNNWVQWTDEIPLTTLKYQKPLSTGKSFKPTEFTNYT